MIYFLTRDKDKIPNASNFRVKIMKGKNQTTQLAIESGRINQVEVANH